MPTCSCTVATCTCSLRMDSRTEEHTFSAMAQSQTSVQPAGAAPSADSTEAVHHSAYPSSSTGQSRPKSVGVASSTAARRPSAAASNALPLMPAASSARQSAASSPSSCAWTVPRVHGSPRRAKSASTSGAPVQQADSATLTRSQPGTLVCARRCERPASRRRRPTGPAEDSARGAAGGAEDTAGEAGAAMSGGAATSGRAVQTRVPSNRGKNPSGMLRATAPASCNAAAPPSTAAPKTR
eukprot:scaffold18700_cov132-Isochrysis_galbana.AAC.2